MIIEKMLCFYIIMVYTLVFMYSMVKLRKIKGTKKTTILFTVPVLVSAIITLVRLMQ